MNNDTITHLKYSDLMANAQELGACTALSRFLDDGLADLMAGSRSAYTLEDLHDFAVELRQRLNRIKV